MKKFEYKVSMFPAEDFQQVAFFCSQEGVCNLESVPADQVGRLEEILNDQGRAGWELAQLVFGRDGLLAFWKREFPA